MKYPTYLKFLVVLSFFAIGSYGQDLTKDHFDPVPAADAPAVTMAAISSTGSGGLWSTPSTWAGGVVPGPGDDVTISPGTAVLIDTDVTVSSVTVGAQVGIMAGVLTFEPFAPHSFTVSGDLTITGIGILTTPTSNSTVSSHTITIGGNLTNNGTLDLSTNNNLAGARLIFTNASSNTFGGNGILTDVRTITVNKGTSSANVLELTAANFRVQGSGTDTPASGYLTLTNGTFKISGTFAGNHRTFTAASYVIPATASLWLNNANYTMAPQNGSAIVAGLLRVSAGTYKVGTATNDSIIIDPGGKVVIEGGSINIAGSLRTDFPGFTYDQSGGTVTTCMAGNYAPCFNLSGPGTGGNIIIQTPNPVPNEATPDFSGSIHDNNTAGTTLRFGNALTPASALFTAVGGLPNVVIDNISGPHTVKLTGNSSVTLRNINIPAGATLDIGDTLFYMTGDTFVNNGTLAVKSSSVVNFSDPLSPVLRDIIYSGSGAFSALVAGFSVRGNTFTIDPEVGNIRARGIVVDTAHIVNTWKLTLGPPSVFDDSVTTVEMIGPASLDFPFNFTLGPSGQKLTYRHAGNRMTGPEINSGRSLVGLSILESSDTLTIADGNLNINGTLTIGDSLIDTGSNRLIHSFGNVFRNNGYIRGTLVHKHSVGSPDYTYYIGDTHCTPVTIEANNAPQTNNPTLIAVKTTDAVLPGLPPSTSASVYWTIEQSAPMSSIFKLTYADQDINGNEQNYGMWRATNQLPLQVSFTSVFDPATNTVRTIKDDLNGTWGISERLAPISISGSVLASNGTGIRNAFVTLSGGNLTAPVSVQTGPFGTYNFNFLEPGGEYTVTASAKRYRFATSRQIISSWSSVANVNFTANPPE